MTFWQFFGWYLCSSAITWVAYGSLLVVIKLLRSP